MARQQIRAAQSWWLHNRPKAPHAFRQEIESAYELLSQQPGAGRPLESPEFSGIRRLALNRTHYFLFYRIQDTAIVIIGLRHQSREEI